MFVLGILKFVLDFNLPTCYTQDTKANLRQVREIENASALTVSNSVNDLLLIDTNGDELTKFDKYFRFTGPLVKRSVEQQGILSCKL